jgi:hypothetical protein
MKQYQISLDSQSIAALDELEQVLQIPKAKVIQKALAKLKEQFTQSFLVTKQPLRKKYIMDSLAGSIQIKDKKVVNYSEHVDDIYLQD